ncbi:MAG: HAMP domain-containing sensor histidine kinase [Bryobacteraceae bacterium]|nr:HAMP domain-containing sensor histidine kinase [Bryobacteraceae bacterium]
MDWLRIRAFAWPKEAEQNESFRRETEALGLRGLAVLGAVAIAVAALSLLIDILTMTHLPTRPEGVAQAGLIIVLGVIVIGIRRLKIAQARAKWIGLAAFFAIGAAVIANALVTARKVPEAYHYVPGTNALVLMVAVGTLPLRPVEALGLGLGMQVFYAAGLRWARASNAVNVLNLDGMQHGVMFLTALLAAVLAGVLYAQRYRAHLLSEETLRERSRALLSESGASIGRLAAAISHELNTPIGALASSVDSLVMSSQRLAQAEESERHRLAMLQDELRMSIATSTVRLKEIVSRMQRFAHLDRAETEAVDLRVLLTDVVELVRPRMPEDLEVRLLVEQMPPVRCRPQQLSSAFYTLVSNAAAVSPAGSRVSVVGRWRGSEVEVSVQDSGPGMDEEAAARLFEPSFRPAGNRMSAANLGLFAARQVVLEHGGEIRALSEPGAGSIIIVRLPVTEAAGGTPVQ